MTPNQTREKALSCTLYNRPTVLREVLVLYSTDSPAASKNRGQLVHTSTSEYIPSKATCEILGGGGVYRVAPQ